VKTKYRAKRRQNYENTDKYRDYNTKLSTSVDKILKRQSNETLKSIGVSQELFDKSIEVNTNDEIENVIKS